MSTPRSSDELRCETTRWFPADTRSYCDVLRSAANCAKTSTCAPSERSVSALTSRRARPRFGCSTERALGACQSLTGRLAPGTTERSKVELVDSHARSGWLVAWISLSSVCVLVTGAPVEPVRACAGISRAGPVFVRGEEALIAWDPESRIEHFVRRAFFERMTDDFGFLVPTPSRPELAEVGSRVFYELFELYRAPERLADGDLPASRGLGGLAGSDAAPSVTVLEERTVAGMDATVLAANDAGALDGWLGQHGYPNGPTLRAYLAPYIASGWIVTAFRIAPGPMGRRRFSSASVRMSFPTDRPFFPYSEPQDNAAPRRFRVSVAAPQRMRAYLDRPSGGARAEWHAASYAGRPGRLARVLAPVLPVGGRSGDWLTTFDEPASRRGTLDLFFEPDPNQRARSSRIRTAIRP